MRTRQGSKVFAWIRPLRHCWKLLAWMWVAILLAVGVNIGSSWLTTPSLSLKNTPLGWLLDHPTITLSLAGTFLLLTGLSYLASRQTTASAAEPPLSIPVSLHQRNRERIRHHLQVWYQQFLDDSLQQATWQDLNLAEKPEALASPVSLLVTDAHLPERLLPAGTSIVQVYEGAHQELVILGEPGSGKSTQLYRLAQHLLTLTETVQMAPLPIVFALSSWAVKRGPLEPWMAEQLTTIYQMPRKLAQQWVAEQQILPLFDGLDEMEEQARPLCIREINRYHREHLQPLVVCSRTSEYIAATHAERIELQQAVVVQPLTATQIETTLKQGGRPLAGLRAAYKQNTALQELATSPLFLNLLILTYQGVAVRDLPTKGEALEQRVFEHYVERMVERKGEDIVKRNGKHTVPTKRYPLTPTLHWLTFLARQMHRHNQTPFAIELLQPDWLSHGLCLAYRWSIGLSTGFIVGLILGLSTGMFLGLNAALSRGLNTGPSEGLAAWLFFGLITGLIGGMFASTKQSITLAEQLQWSWDALHGALFLGMVLGLTTGPIEGWLAWLEGTIRGTLLSALITGLICMLTFWLSLGLIVGLFAGLSAKQNLERTAFLPGEGIRHSFKNGLHNALAIGLIFGLIALLITGLILGLIFGPVVGLIGGLIGGLGVALFFALIVGLGGGLFAWLQHLCLRFWLWRSGYFPLRAIAFLEDARARHLLKRVGGTYQFMHRRLQDYFIERESV